MERPQNDLDIMQTYIHELGGMVSRGEISIGDYSVQQLSQYDFHQALISGVRTKAAKNMLSLDVLVGLGATNLLSRFVPHAGTWINMLAEKFEMKTLDYSFRALNVITASVGNNISEQEFATVKGQVVDTAQVSDYQGEWYGNYLTLMDGRILREYMDPEGNVNYQFVSAIPESRLKPVEAEKNPFQKTLSSFGEIGSDLWSGLTERGNMATDSWYDFGNYLTLGALDLGQDAYAGLQYNAENMTNSPKDFANWATMGGVDMVEAAVNPDDAFSKEHWMSSFGIFLTGAGVRGVNTPRNTGVSNSNSRVKSPGQKRTVPANQLTSTTPKLPTLTNIREWYRVNVPEIGLVQDSMGGYHFAVRRGSGGNDRIVSGVNENGDSKSILPSEGKTGTFKELAKQGTAFDNITPHHMPSAAKMKQAGVKRNNGVSMNMEQPHPGTGGRHRETHTYGLSGSKLEEYLNLSYREALAHDILDVRRIYMKEGLYSPEIREGLLNTIRKVSTQKLRFFNSIPRGIFSKN